MNEDQDRTRLGHGPENLAVLRCESAAGSGADQRDKTLKGRVPRGSRARADTQSDMRWRPVWRNLTSAAAALMETTCF